MPVSPPTRAVSPPDRTMSETPDSILPPSLQASATVVAIVDPVSTGACLAFHLAQEPSPRGVWSDMCPPTVRAHTKAGTEIEWLATYEYHPCHAYTLACQLAKNHGNNVTVMVGCRPSPGRRRTGFRARVARQRQGAVGSTPQQIPTDCAVRSAGLDALPGTGPVCRGGRGLAHASDLSEPFKAVVKPVDGAGSDGVTICDSRDEVRRAFARLEGTKNVLGLPNYNVPPGVPDATSMSSTRRRETACTSAWRSEVRQTRSGQRVR